MNLSGEATAVTILEERTRQLIDAASDGTFLKIHVESVDEAKRAVRERGATALLLSPLVVQEPNYHEMRMLIEHSPGAVPVVVLATEAPTPPEALLTFGACGIRQVVNLAERRGWDQLREIVDQTGGECGVFMTRGILAATERASAGVRGFLSTLVRRAPTSPNVRVLASFLGVHPSTLMSRFFRSGLPSPKAYLSMTRLLYASWFLNKPGVSVAATADALNFSSPQSFGRHVRTMLGLTAGEFRSQVSADKALEHFVTRLIVPYADALREFRPIV